jgi:DNA polymerase delta subunit 1
MPGLALPPPQKRVLTDTTNTAHNGAKSPPSAKKRKLNGTPSNGRFTSSPATPGGFRSKMGSSQPKSHFETEVLEKMTQDISDLKRSNTERDQQWERPSLDDFDEKRDSLCFQQIEIEEGTLHGGQVTLKLFGVSEVCVVASRKCKDTNNKIDRPLDPLTRHRLLTLPLHCSSSELHET